MSRRQIRELEGIGLDKMLGVGVGWGSWGCHSEIWAWSHEVIAGDSEAGLGTGGQTVAYPLGLLSRDSSDSPLPLLPFMPRACLCPRPARVSGGLKPPVGAGHRSGSTPALVLQSEPCLPHPAAARLHPPVFLSVRVTP